MNFQDNETYICEPEADQSRAIIALLRRGRPDTRITGVSFGKVVNCVAGVDELIRWEDLSDADLTEKHVVPAGALSTKAMLQRVDAVCGSAVLSRSALRVFDKPWLLRAAATVGVPVPVTWEEPDAVVEFPVFYKQGFERGGGIRGVARVSADLPKDPERELIYQEVIDSAGTYGVAFVARDGAMLASCTHFEGFSFPPSGGSAVCIERFQDTRLIELTKQLLNQLDYSGWGLAEFKYCPRRADYVLMEINAKFWASCAFTFANEPEFARILFGIETNAPVVPRMVFLHRFAARGPGFVLRNIDLLWSSQIVSYGKISRTLARALLPDVAVRHLKQLRYGPVSGRRVALK